MSRYRRQDEIMSEILEAAQSGASKPRIMAKAYLSFYQAQQYLYIMELMGLIEGDDCDKVFTTTQKGFEWLKKYEPLAELMTVAV